VATTHVVAGRRGHFQELATLTWVASESATIQKKATANCSPTLRLSRIRCMTLPVRLLVAYLTVALPVVACSCRKMTVCQLIVHPPLFIGELVSGGIPSLRQDPWNTDINYARFTVLESFRGLPAGTKAVNVELSPWPGMCSPVPYVRGHKYLVAPSISQ